MCAHITLYSADTFIQSDLKSEEPLSGEPEESSKFLNLYVESRARRGGGSVNCEV